MAQVIGGVLVSGLYGLAVVLSVWLTGRHVLQPGGPDARERIRSAHHMRPWARLVVGQLIMTAAWVTQYDAVNRLSRHWLHLSAIAALVAILILIGVLFSPVSGWRWWLVVICAFSLGAWIYAQPTVLTTQLAVVLVVLATIGKAAQVPMWFAHSMHARFSLISVPLWTLIMVNAATVDFLTQPTDTRVHDALGRALPGLSASPPAAPNSFVQSVLDSHQYFSLGVAAPIAGALFLTVMAVLAREYNRSILLTIPMVSMVVSLGIGLGVAILTQGRFGLAGPWIAVGIVLGVIIAAHESRFWQLLMDPGQNWYQDETHKFL